MATSETGNDQSLSDAALDAMVAEDPNEPGRHFARLVDSHQHVWAVLATLRRTHGDIGQAMAEWGVSVQEVRAAIRYYERHRDVFDAFFLLQQEVDEGYDLFSDRG